MQNWQTSNAKKKYDKVKIFTNGLKFNLTLKIKTYLALLWQIIKAALKI